MKVSQQVTMDAQRVVEEHVIDGVTSTWTRDATVAEQATALAGDIGHQVRGMVSFADTADVEVSGAGNDALVLVRLRGSRVVPEADSPPLDATPDAAAAEVEDEKPAPAPKKAAAKKS